VRLDEVFAKVEACAEFSVNPIPKENLQKLKEAVAGLENDQDVASIPPLLTP
jgi:hypothetical protein